MKIVVSDCDHAAMDQENEIFSKNGMTFTHLALKTEDDAIAGLKDAEIVLNQYTPFTPRVFDALPNLKQIIRYGVGYNNIDVDAATKAGVQICNIPDYGMNEVSDHALALMMALARKIVPMVEQTRSGGWNFIDSMPLYRLCEQTVGIIGLGRIGRLFASKVRGLGCRVICYDKYCTPNEADGFGFVTPVSLDQLIREADIISINCPLTDETRNLIDADAFAKMKKNALIINTARGGIIDEAALAEALASGRIAGAALDTTEKEPLASDSPLFKMKNCLVTPHMSWYSEHSALELKRKVAEEAVRFAKGEPVHYPVNKI
ncbi:C-terminal binding protein [Consotaella salsifontis]|uniref:D-3-phosphoglycerate dehydrogenase n=1 Tax=Consotaella salsifontis TaxID=1365950 RepID=A0A1T4T264_9HYPH|nr:C-terminal binding protein [Consotaella salsifontis]SKA34620.1 D-3-phosphoglycerate dehydrogenase [Consotaella salsifontis]